MSDPTIADIEQCPIIYWGDLTEQEKAEFDYLNSDERRLNASFVRYLGWTYDLGEFIRAPELFRPQWCGYIPDSFFSGVLINFADADDDTVTMGTYYS